MSRVPWYWVWHDPTTGGCHGLSRLNKIRDLDRWGYAGAERPAYHLAHDTRDRSRHMGVSRHRRKSETRWFERTNCGTKHSIGGSTGAPHPSERTGSNSLRQT